MGDSHGDGMREIKGSITIDAWTGRQTGVFGAAGSDGGQTSGSAPNSLTFDTSRVVPTANKNQPRAWGALACVYLGIPK